MLRLVFGLGLMALGSCLAGCNATQEQIKAYAQITQITVEAAAKANVAVSANVNLRPIGGRLVQGFELYGIEISGNVTANPSDNCCPAAPVVP